jgi:hypothetical protein
MLARQRNDTVILDLSNLHGTITLTQPLPVVSQVIEIRGPGTHQPPGGPLTITRSPTSTVSAFPLLSIRGSYVVDGKAQPDLTVRVSGIRFIGGRAMSGNSIAQQTAGGVPFLWGINGAVGGGIQFIRGSLTVDDCLFSQNQAWIAGGGLFFSGQNLVMRDARFSNNAVTGPETSEGKWEGVAGGGVAVMRATSIVLV